MNYSVRLLKQAAKDFKRLCKGSKKALSLLGNAVRNLSELNFDEELKKHNIKMLSGVNGKTEKWLTENNFLPALFEYRNFPKSFPVRIVFAIDKTNKIILIIEVLHHKDMNRSKFMKTVFKRVQNE